MYRELYRFLDHDSNCVIKPGIPTIVHGVLRALKTKEPHAYFLRGEVNIIGIRSLRISWVEEYGEINAIKRDCATVQCDFTPSVIDVKFSKFDLALTAHPKFAKLVRATVLLLIKCRSDYSQWMDNLFREKIAILYHLSISECFDVYYVVFSSVFGSQIFSAMKMIRDTSSTKWLEGKS